MGVTYNGNNLANTFRQSNYAWSGGDTVFTYGGNDSIILNLVGAYGGGNFVDAGSGNDTVTNSYEGDNDILLGSGNDVYIHDGSSIAGNINRYDIVEGGLGNDTFYIRSSHSVYYGDENNDVFHSIGLNNSIYGGSGRDRVSYALQDSHPVLWGLGVEVDLAGNYAYTGAAREEYLENIEDVDGTSYADDILGDSVGNMLSGLGGADLLVGRGGNDNLLGGAGGDDLYGDAGNDVLNGGFGNDLIYGGSGADRFVFRAAGESAVGAYRDVVSDFHRGEGDRIDLSGIDASTLSGGNDSFTFIGSAGFTGAGGELRFAGGILRGDIDGDGTADFEIRVVGANAMVASDFIL